MNSTDTRTCDQCNTTRPISAYARHGRGYRKVCRVCAGDITEPELIAEATPDTPTPPLRYTAIFDDDTVYLCRVLVEKVRHIDPEDVEFVRTFYRGVHVNVVDVDYIYKLDRASNAVMSALQAPQKAEKRPMRASAFKPRRNGSQAAVAPYTSLDRYAKAVGEMVPEPELATKKAIRRYFGRTDVSDRTWYDGTYPSLNIAISMGQQCMQQYPQGRATYYIRESKQGWLLIVGILTKKSQVALAG